MTHMLRRRHLVSVVTPSLRVATRKESSVLSIESTDSNPLEYFSGLIFRQHPRQQSAHLRIDFIKGGCARAGTMYMRVYLYVLYGTRACGMHKYGMYTVTARDDRRFDTAGLSRSPPPRIAIPPRDDATRNDAQRTGRPDCKTDYPPPKKGTHGSSCGLLFLLGPINSHILPLPSGPSIARFICDADRPIRFRCCPFQKSKFRMVYN